MAVKRMPVTGLPHGIRTAFVAEDCAVCGVVFALTADYRERRLNDHAGTGRLRMTQRHAGAVEALIDSVREKWDDSPVEPADGTWDSVRDALIDAGHDVTDGEGRPALCLLGKDWKILTDFAAAYEEWWENMAEAVTGLIESQFANVGTCAAAGCGYPGDVERHIKGCTPFSIRVCAFHGGM